MARPKRHDPDKLKAMILAAARRILLTDGPEALTARALALAVGYTPGTIYNVFDNLASVLWEVNRETFEALAALFADLPKDGPPEDRLLALAEAYIGFMQEHRPLWRGLFDGPRRSESFPGWYHTAIRDLLGNVAGVLHEIAPDAGPERAMRVAEQLYVAIHGITSLWASARLDLITDQSPRALARAIIAAALRDLRAGAR